MSWQEYVDTKLVGTGFLDSAAIFGVGGGEPWAKSATFKIDATELNYIIAVFNGDNDKIEEMWMKGVFVAGSKYFLLRVDDSHLYGKQGKEGIIIVKTVQAILIAHYPDTVIPGSATNVVEELGEYLKSVGY